MLQGGDTPAHAAPGSASEASAAAIEKDSTGFAPAGTAMQQGGDMPSQQDDTPGTPQRTTAPAAKAKTADAKQDDGSANSVQDRAIGAFAPASLTAFPEQARTTTQSSIASVTPAPVQDTAGALRTSEPNMPEAPQLRTGAAQEISIRISQPDASTVDLRVVERSGQVHVDVRSSDPAMQTSLRQDLGTLTGSLERAGYHSEVFTPSSTLARAAASAQTGSQDDRQENRGGAGDFSGGRRQQQQQKRPSTWLEEMEDSK
jgi:hypothetical protein